MGPGNHPTTRKGRERGPRHGGKGHHGRHHDPHPGRAHHDGGTSAAPAPPNTPTHTTEAIIGRHTDHTSARPPATGNHTENGGHTHGVPLSLLSPMTRVALLLHCRQVWPTLWGQKGTSRAVPGSPVVPGLNEHSIPVLRALTLHTNRLIKYPEILVPVSLNIEVCL